MAGEQTVNAYLNDREPWKTAKTDLARTGTTLSVAINAIAGIASRCILPAVHNGAIARSLLRGMGEHGPLWDRPSIPAGTHSVRWVRSTPRWSLSPKTSEGLMDAWVDSHCHVFMLDDPLGAVDRAIDNGIEWMLVPGVDPETSLQARQIAANRPDRVSSGQQVSTPRCRTVG